jgi:uncharacterized protein YbjT (DUF2867 family)
MEHPMSTRILAVIGATGAQGGSLARAALADSSGEWAVRAVTRQPDGDAARELAAAGAEVVRADLDDEDSLRDAFEGAHGAFCVTNFWEHFSGAKEIEQAKNLAQAARASDVQHVIWSTLEDTRDYLPAGDTRMPRLQGEYAVPHFDAKAEADVHFTGLRTTYLRACFFWDNLYAFGLGPTRSDDGSYSVTFPMGDSPMAGMAAEDVGRAAFGVFAAGDHFVGKTVGLVSEFLTIKEMVTGLEAVLPTGPIGYNDPEPDLYRTFGFPGADELGNMFQIYRDFPEEFAAKRDAQLTRELNPGLLTFEQFLAKHKDKIQL